MILGLLLAACSGGDPRLEPVDQALEAYAEGREALDAGKPERALKAFQQAADRDPGSASLQLWIGKAQADAGELEAAIASADRALALQPGLTEALYDRACWRARAGQLEQALADLDEVRGHKDFDPMLLLTDPDLEPLRSRPELRARMPMPTLPLRVEATDEAVFLGGEWTLELSAQHRPSDPLVLEMPALRAPLRLRKLVEDRVDQGQLVETRLRFSYTVTAPGEGHLGPWTARAGLLEAEAAAAPYRLLAPEGSPELSLAIEMDLASARLVGVEVARREGELVTVVGMPGDRVEWEAQEVTVLELREDGQPHRVAWVGRLPQSGTTRLLRGNRVVWERQI